MNPLPPVATTNQVAGLLQVSPRTLERWRYEGTGPAYVKAGRRVLYCRTALEDWIAQSTQCPSIPAASDQGVLTHA
ncbi:MAG TPA: helix-turn-helix domain-containing protein [Beijerinckiaceae bacterium]|jgi:excisionase family DNA binding protein